MPRFLALPEGSTYSVRLFDPITIPFVLGSDPHINILRDNVQIALYEAESNTPAQIQPEYRKLTPYRGEVFYNVTLFAQTGRYSLRVIVTGDVIASSDLYIDVGREFINKFFPLCMEKHGGHEITVSAIS